jgi:hypothetical protein
VKSLPHLSITSSFCAIATVRTSIPSKECNLYRPNFPKGLRALYGLSSREPQRRKHQSTLVSDCIPQLHWSILGKSLNALAMCGAFHGSKTEACRLQNSCLAIRSKDEITFGGGVSQPSGLNPQKH